MNEYIHSLDKTSPVLDTNNSKMKETHLWRLAGKPTALCKKRTKAQIRWGVRNLHRSGVCARHTCRSTRGKSRLSPGARESSREQLALELGLRMIEIWTEGDLRGRDEPSPDRGTSEHRAS